MDREKLKEKARQILDYRGHDYLEIIRSLNAEEIRAITPLIKEASDEICAELRAEHEAYLQRTKHETLIIDLPLGKWGKSSICAENGQKRAKIIEFYN